MSFPFYPEIEIKYGFVCFCFLEERPKIHIPALLTPFELILQDHVVTREGDLPNKISFLSCKCLQQSMDRTSLYNNLTATTANACTVCSGMAEPASAPLQSQNPGILASGVIWPWAAGFLHCAQVQLQRKSSSKAQTLFPGQGSSGPAQVPELAAGGHQKCGAAPKI